MTADRLVPPSTTGGGTAASGDCFVVAATLAMRLAGMGQRVRLVHAIITGQAQIEGVAHWHAWWVTDDDPLAKKRRPIGGLCWELGGEFIDACGRPVDPESSHGWCKMHAAAKRRSDESMARHRAEWDARSERARVDRLLTEDLRQLWLDVCDMRGIDRPGTVAIVDGRARVDHEVLSALLRELRDR